MRSRKWRVIAARFRIRPLFADLNRDDVSPVQGFADRGEIYLPNTALGADLIVSLAKMKTHHWAGATLSMKNYFGVVPGSIYGWPKNELHQIGIDESIVELNRIFRRSFAIVDGIVGMEGNGPIQGTPKPVGVLVMGCDLPAVDATCCRIMGIDPARIDYLRMASERALGVIEEAHIEQRGETIKSVQTPFELIEKFKEVPADVETLQDILKEHAKTRDGRQLEDVQDCRRNVLFLRKICAPGR